MRDAAYYLDEAEAYFEIMNDLPEGYTPEYVERFMWQSLLLWALYMAEGGE